jgi:ubiquinone biosynthesis protein UbiJ
LPPRQRATDALDQVEIWIRASRAKPALRALLERELSGVAQSDAPVAARQFACKCLWILGPDAAVPALEILLASPDEHLVEAACYAISATPSARADAAVRSAVNRAQGRALVAVVNLVGIRGDPEAVPALAAIANGPDKAAAEAAIRALGKIATPEAAAVLAKIPQAAEPKPVKRGTQALLSSLPQDRDGFEPLFNGRDLSEWEVDTPGLWSVRNGVIIGRSPGLKYNDFLRTRKQYEDFVLRAKFRLIDGAGNSGIQFRSKPVPDSHEVSGFQADVGERYWGALYDESRRKKTLAGPPDDFLDRLDTTTWHTYVVSALGNRIHLQLDGVETVNYEEPDAGIARTGLIALQLHADRQPVEVWFRDLQIKVSG